MSSRDSPQLSLEQDFASMSMRTTSDGQQDEQSRLTVAERLRICIDLYAKCRRHCKPGHELQSECNVFQKMLWNTQTTLREAFPDAYNNAGFGWEWEYKLRNSPFLLYDMYSHLKTVQKTLELVYEWKPPDERRGGREEHDVCVFNAAIQPTTKRDLIRAIRTLWYIANNGLSVARFRRGTVLARFVPGASTLTAMATVRAATDAFLVRTLPKTTEKIRAALCQANAARVRRLCHQRAVLDSGAIDERPTPNLSTSWDATDQYSSSMWHRDAAELSAMLASSDQNDFPLLPSNGKCHLCGVHISVTDLHAWKKHVLEDLEPFSCLDAKCLPLASSDSSAPSRTAPTTAVRSRGPPRQTLLNWISHMESSHQTVADWIAHVKLHETRVQSAASLQGGPAPLAPTECPFCDQHSWESYGQLLGDNDQESNHGDSFQGFYWHARQHMYALALLALRAMPPAGSDFGAPVPYETLDLGDELRSHDYVDVLNSHGEVRHPTANP